MEEKEEKRLGERWKWEGYRDMMHDTERVIIVETSSPLSAPISRQSREGADRRLRRWMMGWIAKEGGDFDSKNSL